jgi:NADH:ubiquinone oxidoreductase subunit C
MYNPLVFLLIFEKFNFLHYTSRIDSNCSTYVLIPNTALYLVNYFLKNNALTSYNTLIDATAIDTKKYVNLAEILHLFYKCNRLLLSYQYYFYHTKCKLTFFITYNQPITSLDKLYLNANWLEREISEMFGVVFTFKRDIRKLLLNYNESTTPMLKDYNTNSNKKLFFDINTNQTKFLYNNNIEL